MGGEAMTVIIDHVGIRVSDFERSKAFYREALGVLGIELLYDQVFPDGSVAGFGKERSSFFVASGRPLRGETHVAFAAASQAEVNAFYSVALSMGGRDNGAPGPRPHYDAGYYAAFVLDPDGNNIEAVCHSKEDEA
jgi:catechol 2,3-dioxygenase-like lactoylglutathione lyase family enzyme